MRLLHTVIVLVVGLPSIAGNTRPRCQLSVSPILCSRDCHEAYVEKHKELPGGCQINVGACRQTRCQGAWFGCGRKTYCQPLMEERKFECGEKIFLEEIVAECTCQLISKIEIRGRVVQRLSGDQESSVVGIGSALLSVGGYHQGVSVDGTGHFSFGLPYCPGQIVIKANAEGYVSTLKVLDIPSGTLEIVDNVQVVLFKLADPILIEVGEEHILETSGAVRVKIPAGTTFQDETGNEVGGDVSAILNFVDPSSDNFEDSPGRFVTNTGDELMSFGVLNLRFHDISGNSLIPIGDIRISLVDTDATDYTLWLLNNNGEWVEKSSGGVVDTGLGARNRRQADATDVGSFGSEDIGNWINIDKVPRDANQCFVKARVFDDISFATEVTNNGVDQYQPKFLLKIGNSAPFQGLNLYRPPTYSPAQTCYEVRCGEPPRIHGIVSVWTQETIGKGQSIPLPAVPVQLGNPALPGTLDAELSNLNYQVNTAETEVIFDFRSSSNGPLYDDKAVCESSALTDNSLWFARRKPVFTDTDFGDKFCYARISIQQEQTNSVDLMDQLQATSVWGNDPYYYADTVVQNSEFVFFTNWSDVACVRYRCSEPADLTTVYLDTFVTNSKATCYMYVSELYVSEFTAPVLDPSVPAPGYYAGLDKNAVKENCFSDIDPTKFAGYVSCYIGDDSPA